MCRTLLRPLTPAQQQLVLENKAIVFHIINHPSYRGFALSIGLDEAASVGLLELVMRARTFKPRKGLKFGTYAFHAVATAIRRAAAKRQRGTSRSYGFERTESRELSPEMGAVLHEEVALVGVS